jgi:hypothetical protein
MGDVVGNFQRGKKLDCLVVDVEAPSGSLRRSRLDRRSVVPSVSVGDDLSSSTHSGDTDVETRSVAITDAVNRLSTSVSAATIATASSTTSLTTIATSSTALGAIATSITTKRPRSVSMEMSMNVSIPMAKDDLMSSKGTSTGSDCEETKKLSGLSGCGNNPIDCFETDDLLDKFQKFLFLGDDRNIVGIYVDGCSVW